MEPMLILLSCICLCCLTVLAADPADFLKAVQQGDLEKAAAFLDREPDLANAKAPDGASALLLALYTRHPEVANLLASRGATIGFFEACALGRLERVKAFLSHDPSLLNAFSPDGFNGLSLAAFFERHDVVIFLLARHADPNAHSKNRINITPLHSAVDRRDQTLVEILLSHGADPNAAEFLGGTPLHTAAMVGMESIVQLLVRHGANTNLKMNDGKTARELAAENKHPEIAEWLDVRAEQREP